MIGPKLFLLFVTIGPCDCFFKKKSISENQVGQKRYDPSPGRELGPRLLGMSNKMERMMSFYVVQEITREWTVQTKQMKERTNQQNQYLPQLFRLFVK